jgi:hypothetical protein
MNKAIFGIGTAVRMVSGLLVLGTLIVWNSVLRASDAVRRR